MHIKISPCTRRIQTSTEQLPWPMSPKSHTAAYIGVSLPNGLEHLVRDHVDHCHRPRVISQSQEGPLCVDCYLTYLVLRYGGRGLL